MAAIPHFRDGDVAIATFVSLGSVLAFDVFPVFALTVTLLAGGSGLVLVRRRRPAGRRLLATFVGMVLGAAILFAISATGH